VVVVVPNKAVPTMYCRVRYNRFHAFWIVTNTMAFCGVVVTVW
jgi:hypothetical protein